MTTEDPRPTTEDLMLAELEGITERRKAMIAELNERLALLDEIRADLVRLLMGSSVARKRIAAAAELSEPRLYQIRDGRR